VKPLAGHLECLLYTCEWDLNLLEFDTFEFPQKTEMTFQPVSQIESFVVLMNCTLTRMEIW
jgi:hypothetical protein